MARSNSALEPFIYSLLRETRSPVTFAGQSSLTPGRSNSLAYRRATTGFGVYLE